MSLKVGELYAALTLQSKDYKSGLDDGEKHARGWASKTKGIFAGAAKAVGVSLLAIGAAATVVAAKSLDNAVEQERALLRLDKVFGTSAKAVQKWAESNAMSFGVADDVLEVSIAKYAEFARNAGQSTEAATASAQAMAKRASEIALVTGKSYDEVFAALLKGSQGATKGLKEYGVAVDQNELKKEAMRLGLIKEGEVLDLNSKSLAAQSLILKQTAGYTASAAKMTDSYAKGQLQLGVIVDTVMDTVGAAVLSVVNAAMPSLLAAFDAFSVWVNENGPAIQAIIQAVFDAASAAIAWFSEHVMPLLGAAFQFFVDNVLPVLAEALQWYIDNILPALGDAFDFITTTVIPALGAVFQWIIDNILPPLRSIFETFSTVILPALGKAFAGVQQWIKDNWPTISKIVEQVGGAVKAAFEIIAGIIKKVAPVIVKIGEVVFPGVGEAAKVLLGVISTVFDAIGAIWQTASDVAGAVVKGIGDAWSGLTGIFETVWSGITGIVKGGANMLIGIVNGIIRAINSIQVHIGKIGLDTPAGFVGVGPFDWNGLNLGELSYLARGARNFGGGWAVVGERGPELVNLPPKSDVYTTSESAALAGGARSAGGAGIVTGDVVFQVQQMNASEAEARVFARRLWGYLEDEAFRRGRALQPVRGGF